MKNDDFRPLLYRKIDTLSYFKRKTAHLYVIMLYIEYLFRLFFSGR